MTIGDFFKNSACARPVNAKAVTFTAVSRNEILPGGTPNPQKQQYAAKVDAALVFIGGTGTLEARAQARKDLATQFKNVTPSDGDYNIELTYQVLWRALHEWNPATQQTGERLFPNVEAVRDMVEWQEANRVLGVYNRYVEEEHPDGGPKDEATFPEVESRS